MPEAENMETMFRVIKKKTGGTGMNRLTHERCNGIKTGYWSPEKKESLVNALAAYENTELTPEEIIELKERDTAKEPQESEDREVWYICPACYGDLTKVRSMFCGYCGQRLKWREE